MAAAQKFAPEAHPHFAELRERFGEENARYVVEFLESWRRHYRRAVLIDHGFATAEHEELTRATAEAAGWEYEKLPGSLALLEALVNGEWDEERFLTVPPGHVTVPTNDERILAAAHAPRGADASNHATPSAPPRVRVGSFVYGEAGEADVQADVGLGIDAGGTYTDAVLYEFATGRVLGSSKALTTPHDLTLGIEEALRGLDSALLPRVSYTCLSTTLATNAIVEGRGLLVGLLLMPYHEESLQRIRTPLFRTLGARMTIEGRPERPVDERQVLDAAEQMLAEGAASFAVSGYGSVRNPEHEQQVRDILRRRYPRVPVVCGHELSGRLNFITRANTAVLNARLLPLVEDLLDSVARVLARMGIAGPLFVVRGDGAIMRQDAARERAIETVLSGPAASAAGARFLTGKPDAIVVDMGGTTTDIAVLRDGQLALNAEGARVGGWQTSVCAADIHTVGLGGDSAVRPQGRGRVRVGPGRLIPICFLAAREPGVREELRRVSRALRAGAVPPVAADFYALERSVQDLPLEGREARIVELLQEGPKSVLALSQACGCLAPQLLKIGRLERMGIVRRAGATPTDALHVLGAYRAYDEEAARVALGDLGMFIGVDAEEAARLVREETERQLALAVMRRELAEEWPASGPKVFKEHEGLLRRIVDGGRGDGFELRWRQVRPVVGIGAPAGAYLGACRRLGMEPLIPPHAPVAGAVGAVTSEVVVRELVRIRPAQFGTYVLFAPDGRDEFGSLEAAEQEARRRVVELVRRRGRRFGTARQQVRVEVSRRVSRLQDGSLQLIEVSVEGALAGRPALQQAARD